MDLFENKPASETVDQQVAIIEKSAELFKTAPQILLANQAQASKALAVGTKILTLIRENGMSPELDERANNYLVNCSTALTQMKDGRAAVTQVMTALAKMYTTVENQLDKDKAGTVAQQIQAERNKWAAEQHRLAEQKKREAQLIADKAAEAIQIKHDMYMSFMGQYNDHLLAKKQAYLTSFNAITLENIDEKEELMKQITPVFKFVPQGPYCKVNKYHSNDDLAAFAKAVIEENIADVENNYNTEVSLAIQDLLDKLPSKRAELIEAKDLADKAEELRKKNQEIADKLAEEQNKTKLKNLQEQQRKNQILLDEQKKEQELQEEQKKKRETEDAAKLLQESQETMQDVATTADVKKAGDETLVMFEQENATAEVATTSARQGFEIKVLHSAAWVQIFQLWYEKEGKNQKLETLGKYKLDQMKSFCEKLAHKTNEKIESKLLEYVPTFKAKNVKN